MTLLEEEPQQKPPPSSSSTTPAAADDNNNNHSNTTNTDTNANTNGGGGGGVQGQQQQQQRQTSVDGGDDGHCKTTPRLPRWTRHEILVLIQGKRVVETQVRKARTTASASASASAEPKWVSISSYCKRHGVNREPVQCRKRWSNLAGDYRKIKEWESQIKEDAATADSFWIMRNDLRRERKLPGFFDREIFDVLDDRATTTTTTVTPTATSAAADKEGDLALGLSVDVDVDDEDEEDEAVFDSGRTAAAADDGLFSDFEQQPKQEDGLFSDFEQQSKQEDDNTGETPITVSPNTTTPIPAPLPISERRYQPLYKAFFDRGRSNVKQPASNPEKGSPSQEGQKRRRLSSDDGGDSSLQEQLVKVMESNNKMLAAQLEAQNVNCHLDRDQRKDQGDSLIAVLNKLADALGRIADKI